MKNKNLTSFECYNNQRQSESNNFACKPVYLDSSL